MSEKIKILTISDMPFAPSGVGTQTKNFIEKYAIFFFKIGT